MNTKERITTITRLLIIQTLIILFGVTCQDGNKRLFVDDDSTRYYHLTGVAIDHQTDKPISDLNVRVIADSTFHTVTDSTGQYSLFFEVLPGDYKVTFEKSDYAAMYSYVQFRDNQLPSGGLSTHASLPALILVTKDVRVYPTTKHMSGKVLSDPWNYPEWPDWPDWPDHVDPYPPKCMRVYVSYAGIGQLDRAEVTLDVNLYWICTDPERNYYFGNIPHTDSAFIGIIPFCGTDSCFYGSRSAFSLDVSEPLDLQLTAAPMFDAMYEYRGYDTLQKGIVYGWLGLNDPDSTGHVEGAWAIRKYYSEHWPDDLGPQDGDGMLTGQIQGEKLILNLNPDMADNNVTLVADTGYYGFLGTWYFSTFVGEVNHGTFEANRIEFGP